MISNSILDYFPAGRTPRPVQEEALLFIQENYNKADVLVLNLPVASGKSYIAHAIQGWTGAGGSAILTNNNILVEQYQKDFPKLVCAYGKSAVSCSNTAEEGSEWGSCAERYQWAYKNKKRKYCPGCPYYQTEKRFYTPARFNYCTNYYKYVNLKGRFPSANRPTLIVDEAHNLADAIKMFNQEKVWRHEFNYLDCLDRQGRLDREKLLASYSRLPDPKRWLLDELRGSEPRYIFKSDSELYRGEMRDCLSAQPVDIRGLNNPIFNTGNKLILMSGTIGPRDIDELGLDTRRVVYHEADSCIPADNRPVYFEPVGKIRGQDLKESSGKIAAKLLELLTRYPDSKGLVHATYAQAAALRFLLPKDSRFRFHGKDTKKQVYQEFRADTTNTVLVASGLYEGIDLPDNLGRFQAIAKIPWPNMGEPAVAYQSKINPDWYSWSTAKPVLQACGRICRHPEDTGDTYLLDSTFLNLYTENQNYWPKWWKDSLHGV